MSVSHTAQWCSAGLTVDVYLVALHELAQMRYPICGIYLFHVERSAKRW